MSYFAKDVIELTLTKQVVHIIEADNEKIKIPDLQMTSAKLTKQVQCMLDSDKCNWLSSRHAVVPFGKNGISFFLDVRTQCGYRKGHVSFAIVDQILDCLDGTQI